MREHKNTELSLLGKLEQWHQSDRYDEVVKTLSALPVGEMDDNLYGQLARALNNLQRYEEALNALESVSEKGRDSLWWYRRGFALYYLKRYEEAKQALSIVVQMNPDDFEAEDFVRDCEEMILRERGKEPFRSRVKHFWDEFVKQEKELCALMDEEKMEEAIRRSVSLLRLCFSEPWIELGKNDETYELTLSAQGQKHRLFLLNYWKDHAPLELSRRWTFQIGRKRAKTLSQWKLAVYENEISACDVTVWMKEAEGGRLSLNLFHPVLAGLLSEGSDGKDRAYSIGEILLDQALGEITAMNVVDSLKLLPEKKEEPGMKLTFLFDYVKEHCFRWDENPCDSYSAYRCLPKLKAVEQREDVFIGSSRCSRLIKEFHKGKSEIFWEGMEQGVVFGYLFFNIDEMSRTDFNSFRNDMEKELEEKAGDSFCVIGGAMGMNYFYIDLICFDQTEALQVAKEILNSKKQICEMGFYDFSSNSLRLSLREVPPEAYSEAQQKAVLAHIEENFGFIEEVFLDGDEKTLMIRPEKKDSTVLCTLGMGSRRMSVPRNLRARGIDRIELFMVLPWEWNVKGEGKENSWPMDLLKYLRRLPFCEDSWLGFGQTVDGKEPFSGDTELCGSMLAGASEFGSEAGECTLPDGNCVIFYNVIALYREELDYVRENGAEAFWDLMKEENMDMKLNPSRQNLCQW